MYERSKLREASDTEDYEASALLAMLISKARAPPQADGDSVRLTIDLSASDMQWLCAWGADNEDREESEATEEDIPPQASEQLEVDSRYRFGPEEGIGEAH